jgi:serine O-acetyltransferase
LYGIEFPPQAEVGPGLIVEHRGFGLVVSGLARIGNNVTLFHGVTLGRADVAPHNDHFLGIVIEDDVVLGAGVKVLGGAGTLTVGKGTVVGANSVLLSSTGANQVWAGVPARRVDKR